MTYHNVVPLIEFQRKISVGLNPLGVRWIHHSFTRRPYSDRFGQVAASGLGHPGNLSYTESLSGLVDQK